MRHVIGGRRRRVIDWNGRQAGFDERDRAARVNHERLREMQVGVAEIEAEEIALRLAVAKRISVETKLASVLPERRGAIVSRDRQVELRDHRRRAAPLGGLDSERA